MSIIDRGDKVFEKRAELDHISAARKERGVPRFWMKPDEKAIVVFLDSVPAGIFEHNIKLGDKWGNYFTCVKEDEPCSLCQRGHRPSYIAYLSAIDTREFTRADGTKVKNRKVLFAIKKSQVKRLNELIKKHGDLRGKAFEVSRYSKEESSSGSSYEYLQDVDLMKLEDTAPFNYEKVLAPYARNDLAGLGLATAVRETPATPEAAAAERERTDLKDLFDEGN